MSRNHFLGEVRRGQVLGYGPGAIVDFRAGARGGGPVSVIAAGLEVWDARARPRGPTDPHIVHEPRLQKVLDKLSFRLPPVDKSNDDAEFPDRYLNGYRFPTMLLCPECKRMDYAGRWGKEPGDPSRWCNRCSRTDRRVFAVPARFVMACEDGHIDDFPWRSWLRRRSVRPAACEPDDAKGCKLKLESGGGAGLDGMRLFCAAKGCGASTSLQGAFAKDGLQGFACSGKRPWLGGEAEACSHTPRTLQRGASNLYFPVVFSTLSIPPWSDELQDALQPYWKSLSTAEGPMLEQLIGIAADNAAESIGMSEEDFKEATRDRVAMERDVDAESLRIEEYAKLKTTESTKDFQIRQEIVPDRLAPFISHIGRVSRLREVRALIDFTRIYRPLSPSDPGRGSFGGLSRGELSWLPAVEVRGEGIFIAFRYDALEDWAARNTVAARARQADDAAAEEFRRHHPDRERTEAVTAEFLFVHSMSHALIRRLAFRCGYDAASLRERLYVSASARMAGILIYTSASDADGTLGGLERQGRADLLETTILEAIDDSLWCSSDPLCREGISSLSETRNLAACHACLLMPETSCEHGNGSLDRRLIVDDDADLDLGFFDDLANGA